MQSSVYKTDFLFLQRVIINLFIMSFQSYSSKSFVHEYRSYSHTCQFSSLNALNLSQHILHYVVCTGMCCCLNLRPLIDHIQDWICNFWCNLYWSQSQTHQTTCVTVIAGSNTTIVACKMTTFSQQCKIIFIIFRRTIWTFSELNLLEIIMVRRCFTGCDSIGKAQIHTFINVFICMHPRAIERSDHPHTLAGHKYDNSIHNPHCIRM